jgi:hypothetical protein
LTRINERPRLGAHHRNDGHDMCGQRGSGACGLQAATPRHLRMRLYKEASMYIGKFCNRDVVCATRDSTVAEAAGLMRRHHVGDVIVVDETGHGRKPVGIVTDRDIVVDARAPASGRRLQPR